MKDTKKGKKTAERTGKQQRVAERAKTKVKPQCKSGTKVGIAKDRIEGESKQAILIRLMKNPEGATIGEMAEVSGWQQHSVRGVISGVLKKRLGLLITSEKAQRGRVYHINGSAS